MRFLEDAWRRPDEGIWEVRGGRQHFTHSKVMAWVAFDRAATLAAATDDGSANATRWRKVADEIHADVCRRGYDPELGSFVQVYGSKLFDASLLHTPLVGFLPATDPRVIGTIAAIERNLFRDGFVQRYHTTETKDRRPATRRRRLHRLQLLARRRLRLARPLRGGAAAVRAAARPCNDVGLLSEEYDPAARRMLGNFRQAFSHVGLINTALNLARAEGPAAERAKAKNVDVGA